MIKKLKGFISFFCVFLFGSFISNSFVLAEASESQAEQSVPAVMYVPASPVDIIVDGNPPTGDDTVVIPYIIAFVVSFILIIVLWKKIRKENAGEGVDNS